MEGILDTILRDISKRVSSQILSAVGEKVGMRIIERSGLQTAVSKIAAAADARITAVLANLATKVGLQQVVTRATVTGATATGVNWIPLLGALAGSAIGAGSTKKTCDDIAFLYQHSYLEIITEASTEIQKQIVMMGFTALQALVQVEGVVIGEYYIVGNGSYYGLESDGVYFRKGD